MSAHIQTLLLALTIAFVYWWFHVPALSFYSLQLFAITTLAYFALKKFSQSKIWHIAPATQSIEMTLATLAFLLIIGATGNTSSIFFPLTYLHLFFLVFTTHTSTSIVTGLVLMLFHYALGAEPMAIKFPHLITIPIMLMLFLFTKDQYNEVIRGKSIIRQEEKALTHTLEDQHKLKHFLTKFVLPKVLQLKDMSLHAAQNRDAIMGQLMVLEIEINKLFGNETDLKKKEVDDIEVT